MAKIIKMKDLLEGKLNEKKPWQGYKAHAVHGKARVDFLNLMSGNVDWKKYNKLTDKGKNIIFFMRKKSVPLVWQTSNGREVQATNLKGDESSYKSYKVDDIYKILIEGKLKEGKVNQSKVNSSFSRVIAFVRKEAKKLNDDDLYALTQKLAKWFK